MQPLIVFSHLRWDFVYQRPQHLVTRLARYRPVYFFEEPLPGTGPAMLETSSPTRNVVVCQPRTPISARGFHDDQLPTLQPMVRTLMAEHGIREPLAWLYTPMALPLVQQLGACAVVYDCMDELSMFRNAPKQLLQREGALLKSADVVFTGGPSLYQAKRLRHDRVYCFPSSVEKEHFAQACNPALDHPAQRELPHPRLGFYGVLDERLDIDLLQALARARPQWQFIMVGPVVKIEPAALPHLPNIHYFGQQPYGELPRFLAGWDICLLPFAINQATRFISPTKTLEYMAACKPIVSTPVQDVVEPYGQIVRIAGYFPAFLQECEDILDRPAEQRAAEVSAMREIVARTSWDQTAEQMHGVLEELCAARQKSGPVRVRTPEKPKPERVVVIGAGPTGLSAAYHLGEQALLLEQNDRVGGWCRSLRDNGFTFDHAGHIMFSNDPYVQELYRQLLGDNVHWQDREAWIYSKGVHTRYPFQAALYGLPPDVLRECLVGAIEARFGPLNAPGFARGTGQPPPAPHPSQHGHSSTACKAESITDCCADGSVEPVQLLPRGDSTTAAPNTPRNFEEFIHAVWGRGIAKHFALPYNRKLWSVPLSEMETSWLGGRVPLPNLEEMIDGALRPVAKPMGPNARFGYPLRGGFQALMDAFLPHLRGEVRLSSRVARIIPSEHELVLEDGSAFTYEQLISTMPLPELVRLIGHEAPGAVRGAAGQLRHISVRCVNLGIGREHLTDKHWIYYPEEPVFHRIFVQGNASPHVNAPGGFALTCEITYSPEKPLPCDGEALIDRCIADCISVGMIRPDDPVVARNQVDMPYAYVVYDHARKRNVDIIRRWLGLQDIILAGRYSEWEYYNSDHAFLAGRKAAETALAALSRKGVPTALSASRNSLSLH
jgi:protoporphyrinogen oxidase/glycosyltransferase involved in cell wall biosynthesis